MTAKTYEIRVVKRNRRTGEEIVNVSSEYMARSVYGDKMVDVAIAKLETKNSG